MTGNSPIAIEYFNDKKGMRQDFIVDQRLPGNGPLRLELGVKTEGVSYGASKQEVSFVSNVSGGTMVMQYANLKVTDANGKELAAYFEKQGDGQLAIVVDDALALYPIVIDPLSTSPSWTAESNQAGAYFGWSVASAGDVNGDGYSDVIVGDVYYDNGQTDEGRTFVYHGSSAGLSTSVSWTAESDQANAQFGYSVASAGDVNGDGYSDVVVGTIYYDNGQVNEGRAYVYHGSSAGLVSSPAWTAESNVIGAHYGNSVSTAGDINGDGYSDVIIGAYAYGNGSTAEGRAYAYHGSSTGLLSTPTWTANGTQTDEQFGTCVASAGDVNGDGYSDAIISSWFYSNDQVWEGRAFVYHGSSTGLSSTVSWTAEDNQDGAGFGYSLAAAGDVNGDGYSDVIIGADRYSNGQDLEGKAYVYHGSSAGLSILPNWTMEGNQIGATFGYSVASAGDVNGDGYSDIIIGALLYDNGQTDEGRAYMYYGSSSGLATTAGWTAESDQASAYFGYSVATAGDVNGDGYSDVLVGALQYDNDQTDEGRAFVYQGSTTGLSSTAAWIVESDQAAAYFGVSVASAGDVNGDGYSDVIVGASGYDNGQTDEGRAFVYHGSPTGLATTADWIMESNQASCGFGCKVASAGDVNGDGYYDVIIGAYSYSNDQSYEGRAFVYHGSSTGLSTTANWTAESNQSNSLFGWAVASAGDVNGDGYSDVIIGARCYSNGQSLEGRAFVYHGSSTGLSTTANWTAESDQASADFGSEVSSAGDVNGDGYSDIIVGADGYDNGQTNEGRAFVYHGSSTGLSTIAAWTTESNQASSYLGEVSSAGDVNGDGYSDVIVGAFYYDNGQYREGCAWVFHGSVSGLTSSAAWIGESDQAYGSYGVSVASAGDVNGDGYSDVIIGASGYDNGQIDEGRAYLYLGSASGLASSAVWTAESDRNYTEFSRSVASAGDVNGDGYSDVIIGAVNYDNAQTNEGAAYLFYGNGGSGAKVYPRQFRANQTTPVVAALTTYSTTQAGLSLWGRTFYGRSSVKAQFEVKSRGTAFNGSSLNETSWTNVGTAGTNLAILKGSLASSTLYKWRGRIKYSPTLSVQRYSPWYFLSATAMTECDFRTMSGGQQELVKPHVVTEEPRTANVIAIPLVPYPNPFKSFTSIPGYEDKKVVVYDLTGRKVGVFNGARVGEGLNNGIYFVRPLDGIAKPVKLLKVR